MAAVTVGQLEPTAKLRLKLLAKFHLNAVQRACSGLDLSDRLPLNEFIISELLTRVLRTIFTRSLLLLTSVTLPTTAGEKQSTHYSGLSGSRSTRVCANTPFLSAALSLQ
jgi:hypothetical protein